MIISIADLCGNFAENKDKAREIREQLIRPTLEGTREKVVLDFSEVDSSTQSFIHALVSDFFQNGGEVMLKRFEFKNCSAAVKSLIATVINYSLQ